ncbi:hypothetical protein TNCV_1873581 [Trichonephila clavipes]|nr:hypothetical protein TNCV_1873581 [Trichonephila clavipes]
MNSDCTEQKEEFRAFWSLKKRHPGYQKLFRPSWSLNKRHTGNREVIRPSCLRSNAAPVIENRSTSRPGTQKFCS